MDRKKVYRIIKRTFLAVIGIIIILLVSFYLYENRNPGYRLLSDTESQNYREVLEKNGKSPQNYILDKFKDHSVVILGEPHRVREHYCFLIDIMASLPGAGVNYLGIEFFSSKSQSDIDKLLSTEEFNSNLARQIVLQDTSFFYYQELYDILKKGWEINRSGANFSIIGLYGGGGYRDYYMATKIDKILKKSNKILVYCGTHHAFTSYCQPGIKFWERPVGIFRMGQFLKHEFKDDPFFIQFHYPVVKRFWLFVPILLYRKGYTLPFSGVLDQVFQKYGQPVGFDAGVKEFDDVIDSFSYYSCGYGTIRLKDFCDGYIYLKPLDKYSFVTPLKDICSTNEECEYIKKVIPQKYHILFENKESAEKLLQREGISPEEMLKMLDIRGLENLFRE